MEKTAFALPQRLPYVAPRVELFEIAVDRGFAQSFNKDGIETTDPDYTDDDWYNKN